MKQKIKNRPAVLRELSDDLILRRATVEDTEELTTFNAKLHSDEGPDEPSEHIAAWVRDLMEKPHPTFGVGDFTIVEDTKTGKIVSSLNLIPQTWNYCGVEFGVGRVELVGTDPDYRKRGLIRAQFEVIHQWCVERDLKVQAITGIPYYYRQFGYEMGLALGGGRIGYLPHIPKLKEGEKEPYRIRPVTEDDISFINKLSTEASKRYLISCLRDEALWRYEINGRSEKNINCPQLRFVETQEGEAVGFFAHPPHLWGPTLILYQYELKSGISWLAVTPSVLRYMKDTGEEYARQDEKKETEFGAFGMWMGREHPVYEAISDHMPRRRDSYAWYIRVPDLPGFLKLISPVLEQRLSESVLAGHSGELKISFFRNGVKLTFNNGALQEVENFEPENAEDGDVLFPDLTFLQVLFGHRSFAEVEYAFADSYPRNDHGRALTPILFPKQASNVWPIA